MIEKCIVLRKRFGSRSANFDLKLQNGRELHITNCHLLNIPYEEIYMGTYEFLDQTGIWHYPIVHLRILRSKRTMQNANDTMPKRGIVEIRYNI